MVRGWRDKLVRWEALRTHKRAFSIRFRNVHRRMYCHQSKWFWPFCGQQRPRRADCSYVRDNAAHPASNLGHCCGGPQTSQKSKRYLIILSARSVTCSKFHTQNPHVLGGTAQNFVARLTGVWDFCTPAVLFLFYSNLFPAQSCHLWVYQRTNRQATSDVIGRFILSMTSEITPLSITQNWLAAEKKTQNCKTDVCSATAWCLSTGSRELN
jgi:hypothetical protein